MNLRTYIGRGVLADLIVEGTPTQADIRRLIAYLTLYMTILDDAPDAPKVTQQLADAHALIYPAAPADDTRDTE